MFTVGSRKAEGEHLLGGNRPRATPGKPILVMAMVTIAMLFVGDTTSASQEQDAENASNPLAKSRNTDLRYQYFDLVDGSDRHDAFVDGSFMATDRLKIKYELHYWETNVTGRSEHDWEKLSIKPIYFPTEGAWGSWKYRVAVGFEWILDAGNDDKGIGSGSDQLAPLVGVALIPRPGTILIPLVQQFWSYSGNDVNTTGPRLIALQTLPDDFWAKLDVKTPIDWENDNAIPATIEIQLGKHLSNSLSVFADGLVGIGGDRPYEYGLGVGVRFKY